MTKPPVSKKHDVEETPRDTARRLLREAVIGRKGDRGLADRWNALDKKIQSGGRYYSPEDQRELLGWLERRLEITRTLVEGVGEAPEFSLSSELLDHLEDDQ